MFTLLGCVLVCLQQQSYAEKMSHKEYASMAIKECNVCHKGEGIAPNHDADFVREHRMLAGKAGNNCNQCHDQAWCLDCHQGGGNGSDLTQELRAGLQAKEPSQRLYQHPPDKGRRTTRSQCISLPRQNVLQRLPQPLSNGLTADQVAHDAGSQRSAIYRRNWRTYHRGAEKSAIMPELSPRRGRLHPVPQQRQSQASSQKLEVQEISKTGPMKKCALSVTCPGTINYG